MIAIFLIKTALLRFGIVVQAIEFDVDNECVIVKYTLNCNPTTKSVPFSEIEQLFTSKPAVPADDDKRNVVGSGYEGPGTQ